MSVSDHFPRLKIKPDSIPEAEQRAIRDRLAMDIAAFMEAGGEVEEIPFGVSSEPESISRHEASRKGFRNRAEKT